MDHACFPGPSTGGSTRLVRVEAKFREVRLPASALAEIVAVGLLVDAPLAARLELEVLDRVGDVGRGARSMPGLGERRDRAAGRPGRRTAGPPGPPGRPAARRRTSPAHPAGPSPNTVWVARLPERAAAAAPRPRRAAPPACRPRACSRRWPAGAQPRCGRGVGFGRRLAHHRRRIRRRGRRRSSGGMSDASGRFRQYRRGISLRIAATFSRAGLKMRGVVAAPAVLQRIVGAAHRRDRPPGHEGQRLAIPMGARRPASGSTSASR